MYLLFGNLHQSTISRQHLVTHHFAEIYLARLDVRASFIRLWFGLRRFFARPEKLVLGANDRVQLVHKDVLLAIAIANVHATIVGRAKGLFQTGSTLGKRRSGRSSTLLVLQCLASRVVRIVVVVAAAARRIRAAAGIFQPIAGVVVARTDAAQRFARLDDLLCEALDEAGFGELGGKVAAVAVENGEQCDARVVDVLVDHKSKIAKQAQTLNIKKHPKQNKWRSTLSGRT